MLSFPYIYKNVGSVKIVTWADGTAAELAAMLAAHDEGIINIYDYWKVGDTRTVHLNAITANPDGAFINAMDAQDVEHILMDKRYANQQKIHFVVGQKDCLNQKARINATNTNTGSWNSSLIRIDLNDKYYNSIADRKYASLFKDFPVTTIDEYNGSTLQTVLDKFALFAEKEVFGSATHSNTAEADALTQIEYYKTAANRVKQSNGVKTEWWERSPHSGNAASFCYVSAKGTQNWHNASNYRIGVAPFGCI